MPTLEPGLIVLLGSAGVEPAGDERYDVVARRLPERPRITMLETPAGFEPTPALLAADAIVLAPGSATDTVRQLRNSLALQTVAARQRRGAALILSGAAAMAFSTYTLPVYEIHQAGEALHWKQGLDYFAQYGLPLSVVPRWDDGEGDGERDTGRCTIGRERFWRLHAMLPAAHPILGIDEDAALLFDFARGSCCVQGSGGVTYLRNGINHRFPAGACFPLGLLGLWAIPDGRAGIPQAVWEQAGRAEAARLPAD